MNQYRIDIQSQNLFFLFYSIYCIKTGIFSLKIEADGLDALKLALNILLLFFSLLTFITIKKTKIKTFYIMIMVLFILNLVIYNNDYYFGFVFIISLLLLSTNIPWISLIKLIMAAQFISIVILTPLIFFSDRFFYHDERFGDRFTMGFDNPNSIAQYLLSILCIILLKLDSSTTKKTTKIIFSLFTFTVISSLIYMTQSRTALTLTFIILPFFLLSLFITKKENEYKKTKLFIIAFSITLIIIQFILTISYNQHEITLVLNETLSGRIWHSYNIYSAVGLPNLLIGTSVIKYLPLDFYYIQTIYGLGFLPFLFLYLLAIKRLLKSLLSFFMLMVIFLMVLETLTETYFSVPYYSIALFIIFHKNQCKQY
ncbi:hypothetical protein [Providencia sp. wls1914]|uniref:hypothetical protein n=1 Tax=Providencia sp. wls1914 TaxID=2675156 RepID=UPI0012B658CB|nr:hypothetical protein [Providencia sp. wls1914]